MSVVVLGMEMPNNCCECELCYDLMGCGATGEYFYKGGLAESGFDSCNDRLPNCPLRPLPDHHGRLIDGDELSDGCDAPHWCRWKSEIDDMPTIIEKESE